MKKVGIFALLGCLVTVGGVYAQWVYSQATAGEVSGGFKVTMAAVGNNSKKGLINVDTSHVVIEIDDGGSYVPKVVVTGDIKVTFTPDAGADSTVKTNGILMDWSLSIPTNWKFDKDGDGTVDTEIFTLENATQVALNPVDGVNTATLAGTISAARIAESIKLNVLGNNNDSTDDDFKLDNLDKFKKFQNELNSGDHKFTITVREVPTTL